MRSQRVSPAEKLENFFSVMSSELRSKQLDGPKAYARDRLLSRMRKRAEFTQTGLADKAISSFMEDNNLVGSTPLRLSREIQYNARYFIQIALERYTSLLDPEGVQETLDLGHIFDSWRFGPGASNGVRGTHTADKISQKMTCTPQCASLVLKLRKLNPYFRLFDESQGSFGISIVQGSRLTTVPKNEETERTIAIEPSGNMALQLAAGRYLEETLRRIGLDIRTQQPKNKALACSASINGSMATIDLKSASNLISQDLVRALFPPEWCWLLWALRSHMTKLPNGEWVRQNMISTMGNGFTFPLMTLILCALIYANRAIRGGPSLYIDWSSTAVFGDDIIVPTSEYVSVCETLESAGFIVNNDKSYSTGQFRESCGGDYLSGYDVTPFYVRRLTSDPDVYVALNQVFGWCARHNIILPATLLYLKGLLTRVHLVPEWHGDDSGLRTPGVERRYTYLSRDRKSVV